MIDTQKNGGKVSFLPGFLIINGQCLRINVGNDQCERSEGAGCKRAERFADWPWRGASRLRVEQG